MIVTLMKKKFVDEYHWIEENEMLDLVAIAQSSPGPIAVNGAIVVGYKLAGLIGVPGNVDFHFDFGFPPQTSFACMAETMILALEKRYENFTLGRKLTIEQIDTISQLARKHDFSLAGFRNFERAVTDEEIAHIQGFVEQELAMRNI